MSASLTPGINAPTQPLTVPGLINSAPGQPAAVGSQPAQVTATTVPPPTGYTPQAAKSSSATATGITPNEFQVTPDQTVSHQIANIIASGSPLMQMAEANANKAMNARGLINSSTAITAGQDALYTAAEPIAAADANTYAAAATNTTNAKNAALSAEAAARNTAGLTNAQLETQNSQFNAGAANTEAAATAAAANTFTGNLQQIAGSTKISELQTASAQAIAHLQADTSLSVADKNNAMSQILAGIQANTSLSVADKNNAMSLLVAKIQGDTSRSVADQQATSAQIIAEMNNNNARALAATNNAAALANIQANGAITTQVQQLTNDNKTLLQTSAGASQIYTQVLTNMSSIISNPNLSTDQQTTALNNQAEALKDALAAMEGIANNQTVTSNLNFTAPAPPPATPANPFTNPFGGAT